MRPFSEKEVDAKLEAAMQKVKPLADIEMTEDNLSLYAYLVSSVCNRSNKAMDDLQRMALFNSVSHLIGKKNKLSRLKANTHRLIANWYLIKDGVTIPFWDGEQTTSDALFISVRRGTTRKNAPCLLVKTKLKTGISAGIIITFPLLPSSILHFMDHLSGCTRMNCAAEELAGMRARITFSVVDEVPYLQEWDSNEYQRNKNKELTNARCDPGKCDKAIPCDVCKCTVAECALAVWAEETKNGK